MPSTYNVQQFTNNKDDSKITCFGNQPKHNHKQAIQFTKDIKTWLVKTKKWEREFISQGDFDGSQPKPSSGQKFTWNGKNWLVS